MSLKPEEITPENVERLHREGTRENHLQKQIVDLKKRLKKVEAERDQARQMVTDTMAIWAASKNPYRADEMKRWIKDCEKEIDRLNEKGGGS